MDLLASVGCEGRVDSLGRPIVEVRMDTSLLEVVDCGGASEGL